MSQQPGREGIMTKLNVCVAPLFLVLSDSRTKNSLLSSTNCSSISEYLNLPDATRLV
jgi:hypothetical protein